jgi:hypothetical protein
MKKSQIIYAAIIIIIVFVYAGYFTYKDIQNGLGCTQEAKICPDGSAVGRTGPKCEFAACPNSIVYSNKELGFELTLPSTWQGYSVSEQTWQGWGIDNFEQKYSGPKILITNAALASKGFPGIPIMVFTPEQWSLVSGYNPTIAVSAAPIGPAEIGQNSKYTFATPPRYIGFAGDLSTQDINQVYEIVKTFKAF